MVTAIYGILSPASGAKVDPVRDKGGHCFDVLVQRANFPDWEHKGCIQCGNSRDLIVLSIDKEEVFFDCPCGHRWLGKG